MFSKTNRTKKSFIGAIAMSLVLLMGSAFGFLLETNLGQITKPTYGSWVDYVSVPNGSGTSESPYQVSTPQELAYFAKNGISEASLYIEIFSDIDLAEHEWEPIQRASSAGGLSITINIKGNNHMISNITVNKAEQNYSGLFASFAKIVANDIVINNATIIGKSSCGVLCGDSGSGNLNNIIVKDSTVIGESGVGGLIGNCGMGITISNCIIDAEVSGTTNVGGIGGFVNGGFKNCIFTGEVKATGSYIGGIVGRSGPSSITNCYVEANIYGLSSVGGLCGANGNVTNSGFKGRIEMTSNTSEKIGAFVAENTSSSSSIKLNITNCFALVELVSKNEAAYWQFGANPNTTTFKSAYVYSKVFSDEGLKEYRKYKTDTSETEPFKDMVYHKNINGGYPFPKTLFAVGQFIKCDTLSYLQDYMFNYIEIKNDGSHYYIEYGEYPQTYVGSELNNTLENAYNSGIILEEPFMSDPAENRSAKVFNYNGGLYARLEDAYTRLDDIIFQNGEAVVSGNTYWFKFEPIKWRVLNYAEYMKGAPLIVISEKTLNSMAFSMSSNNSWEDSVIRKWVNGTFYDNVFGRNGDDKIIMEVEKKNNNASSETDGTGVSTMDKIWSLSQDEITKYMPTDVDMTCHPTDYALVNYVMIWSEGTNNQCCYWWSRTAVGTSEYAKSIYPYGGTYDNVVTLYDCGVRPAMTLNI